MYTHLHTMTSFNRAQDFAIDSIVFDMEDFTWGDEDIVKESDEEVSETEEVNELDLNAFETGELGHLKATAMHIEAEEARRVQCGVKLAEHVPMHEWPLVEPERINCHVRTSHDQYLRQKNQLQRTVQEFVTWLNETVPKGYTYKQGNKVYGYKKYPWESIMEWELSITDTFATLTMLKENIPNQLAGERVKTQKQLAAEEANQLERERLVVEIKTLEDQVEALGLTWILDFDPKKELTRITSMNNRLERMQTVCAKAEEVGVLQAINAVETDTDNERQKLPCYKSFKREWNRKLKHWKDTLADVSTETLQDALEEKREKWERLTQRMDDEIKAKKQRIVEKFRREHEKELKQAERDAKKRKADELKETRRIAKKRKADIRKMQELVDNKRNELGIESSSDESTDSESSSDEEDTDIEDTENDTSNTYNLKEFEQTDGAWRCKHPGCTQTSSTKNNICRHMYRQHNTTFLKKGIPKTWP